MAVTIKMLKGVFQTGNMAENKEIECRIRCDKTLDTISFHAEGTIISVPLKSLEKTIERARKNEGLW